MLRKVILYTDRKLLKLNVQYLGSPIPSVVRKTHSSSNAPPAAPQLAALTSSEETDEARSWLARFKTQPITRGLVDLSFSRSSGPGGQVCSWASLWLYLSNRILLLQTEREQG